MPILLGKNKKKALPTGDGKEKWYPYVKTIGTVTEKEVAKQIAERTTLNPKEAEMALSLLEEVVLNNLLEGKTVMLGEWAFFYSTVTCEGSLTEEEVTPSKVREVKIHLRIGNKFKRALQNAKFIFMEELLKSK